MASQSTPTTPKSVAMASTSPSAPSKSNQSHASSSSVPIIESLVMAMIGVKVRRAHQRAHAHMADHEGSIPEEGDRQAPCAIPFGTMHCTSRCPADVQPKSPEYMPASPSPPSLKRTKGRHWEGALTSPRSSGEGVH
jgi:hypothetical protein